MSRKTVLFLSFFILLVLILALFVGASAQINGAKPFEEGLAGKAGSAQQQGILGDTKPYAEGDGAQSAGFRLGDMSPEGKSEGEAGSAGHASGENLEIKGPAGMTLLFRFSGVSDDGEQGSASRREATSIHCTNIDSGNNQIEVQVWQWNGTDVFTGTVNMPPNRTFTFSTQNTTIYFDDVLLGGSPGTDPIFQGSGQIWGESSNIVCSAQVLDPLNYPPIFATGLEMYQK
jgi:hypothetical protein